jgi:hypothetical protein
MSREAEARGRLHTWCGAVTPSAVGAELYLRCALGTTPQPTEIASQPVSQSVDALTCTYVVCPGTCLVVRDVQEMTRVTFVTWWSIVLSLLNSYASCGVLQNQIHMINDIDSVAGDGGHSRGLS